LINWIGRQTEAVVLAVNEECRLAVAILLILWVSALASAFVDNIPLTTMMVRIVSNLNQELDLPLQPLVWALAFGACLGGEILEILIERGYCGVTISDKWRQV
jgi:Na+/H+ antiporter NhaD/arsenite permease-like protein